MLKLLLQTSLLAAVLSGCSFHRLQSNSVYRDLDPAVLTVGESTWRDVLNELGPPSGSTTARYSEGLNSMASFRYGCADEKRFAMLFAYLLYLPFKWEDKQTGYELVVEFDRRGVVSDLYSVTEESAWRPFQSPGGRQVSFYSDKGVKP